MAEWTGRIRRKLGSRSGESIMETLVALLISALALVMLAGAISTSSSVITRSRRKLAAYYGNNEAPNGVVLMSEDGAEASVQIRESAGAVDLVEENCPVEYYENAEFARTPVISYRYRAEEEPGTP